MQPDILHQPKVFLAMYKDKKFKGSGLRCRRLGPGRYRFVRKDGKPMHSCLVLVEIAKPWADERAMVAVLACARHGFSCPPDEFDGETCKRQFVLVEGSRWMPRVVNNGEVEVEILRYPKTRTVAGARRGKATPQDADFFIQVISRD
jgi:hypothetical protein